MHLIDFNGIPVWGNVLILAVGGLCVWLAGTKLARLADAISNQTRLSRVMAGALLLGFATSLPEIATSVTASALGNAPLAVNNLLGGVAMQLAVLAFVDYWFVRHGPLTFFSPDPVLLLGGVLLILQIALLIVAITVGDRIVVGHLGSWPLLLTMVYGLSLFYMNRFSRLDTWTPAHLPDPPEQHEVETIESATSRKGARSLVLVGVLFVWNCLLVLVGGWAVSSSADALSIQTGIGSGFIGATLAAR